MISILFCEKQFFWKKQTRAAVLFFPNPAKSQLHIRATSVEIARVEIYSTLGTLVKKVSNNKAPINIEEISSWLYLVKIYTEKGIVIKRFLKN